MGEISICGVAARGENFTLPLSIWSPKFFTLPPAIHNLHRTDMFVHSEIYHNPKYLQNIQTKVKINDLCVLINVTMSVEGEIGSYTEDNLSCRRKLVAYMERFGCLTMMFFFSIAELQTYERTLNKI